MNAQEFIQLVAPVAQTLWSQGSPLFPSVRIAQAALETGWRIPSWNNMVGYKVGSGKLTPYWSGKSVTKGTWEVYDGERQDVQGNFRVYDSIENSFRDQDLLFNLVRYQPVWEAKTPQEQAKALYQSGYATDPLYAKKLIDLIKLYNLTVFDTLPVQNRDKTQKEDDRLQLTDWQWEMLKSALDYFYQAGLLVDPSWKEKVDKKDLSISELTWLNTILLKRNMK